jgi:hypothetical protein
VSLRGDLIGRRAGARQFDHRADQILPLDALSWKTFVAVSWTIFVLL